MLLILAAVFSLAHADPSSAVIRKIEAKTEAIRRKEKKLVRAELENGGSKEFDGEKVEESKGVVFRERGVIQEIREEYSGEMGASLFRIYYGGGKAFFVLEERTNIATPMMTEMEGLPKPVTAKVEHKYYIDGGRVIQWLDGGKPVAAAGDRFKKRESEILDLAADAFDNAN